MLLTEVLETLLVERPIRKITAQQYSRAVRRFGEFLQKVPTVEDLTIENVNGCLRWLETDKNQSPVSVRNHRIGLLCIWNFAVWPLCLTPEFVARRIRQPKIVRSPVRAWPVNDVAGLLEVAGCINGTLRNGVPVHLVLTAWIRVGFETGLRPSDIRRLTWRDVDFGERTIAISQSKTSDIVVCGFSLLTAQALEALKPYGFSAIIPIGKAGFHKLEKKLYASAKARFGFERRKRQGIGTLRKTHGTEVYRAHGVSAAAEALGHRSGVKVVKDHYIDSSVRNRYVIVLPPVIPTQPSTPSTDPAPEQ